jgi:hypothetical protein
VLQVCSAHVPASPKAYPCHQYVAVMLVPFPFFVNAVSRNFAFLYCIHHRVVKNMKKRYSRLEKCYISTMKLPSASQLFKFFHSYNNCSWITMWRQTVFMLEKKSKRFEIFTPLEFRQIILQSLRASGLPERHDRPPRQPVDVK